MANPRFIQAQSFQISAAGASAGDTSLTVQSFKLLDGTTNIVTANLGDQCYATLEPGNGTQEEAIQFTGVTQNSNGTATLTGVSSVGFVYPYTVSSGLSKSHAGGSTLILSNDAGMYGNLVSYVQSVVASGAATATDTTAGITKLTFNQGSNPRARSTLVSQNGAGTLGLLINTFSYVNGSTTISFVGKALAYINGSAGSTFTAPSTNPRYDLIVYRPSLSDCTSITGTEAASPSLPTATTGDIVLAAIYHRVGETKILDRDDSTNGYIYVWYEPTLYTTTTSLNNQQITFGTDQSNSTTNATYAVGEANATSKHSIIAQSFVPTVTGIQGVKLWKIADTGTFTGTVKVSIQASSGLAGTPSGTDLASYTISNAAWLKLNAAAEFAVAFSTEYESLTVGSTYWIVVTPSTSDNSNHPNLGYDNTSAHSLKLDYNNSTDGWVTTATACLYYKTMCGTLSKIVQTDSTVGYIPSNVRPYSLVSIDKTTSSSANTNEVTVYSTQLEGGFFTLNSGIKATLSYNARPTSSALTIKFKHNGSTLATVTVTQENSSAVTAGNGILDLSIINNASLSSQINVWRSIWLNNAAAAATSLGISSDTGSGTSAVDLSQPGLFEVTFQIASTTNTSWAYNWLILEKIG